MNFKTMNLDDIINWCQANNQIEWLKAEAARMMPCKVYPKGENGKKDKSAKPSVEMRPITFIQIKTDFVNKFMPEIAPQKKMRAPSMYDRIKLL